MKIQHKALILGVVTEAATVAWFIAARGQSDGLPRALVILHSPVIFLNFMGVPWLLSLLIETAVWVLFWFLLIRLFAPPRYELSNELFAGSQRGLQESPIKKIEPR